MAKRGSGVHHEISKRQRTNNGSAQTKVFFLASEGNGLLQYLNAAISAVLSMVSEATGESILVSFLKVPPRKLYPDYYSIVKTPIAIGDIQKKLSRGRYVTKEEFIDDFRLMLDNAMTYNDPDSWIVKDAQRIHDRIVEELASSTNDAPPKLTLKLKPSASSQLPIEKLAEQCLETLEEVIAFKFPEDGILSTAFLDNVDIEMYPDYTQFVSNPTSFNIIRSLIKLRKLFNPRALLANNLKRFHDEVDQIFTNAQIYNDPSAIIYQDAVQLRQLFEKKYEILVDKIVPGSGSSRRDRSNVNNSLDPVSVASNSIIDDNGNPTSTENEESNSEHEAEGDTAPAYPVESGKSALPLRDLIIQELSLASALPIVNHILQLGQKNERLNAPQNSVAADIRQSLFPTSPTTPITTFFEYKVPSNGYESLAYTITLPADVLPFVSFKVLLHNLIYAMKKPDMSGGKGVLNSLSDEEFHCSLFVNEEEVSNGGTCYEDKRFTKRAEMLGIQYDVRLSHGLNVLDFECKVAPALSRKIKHTTPQMSVDETAGRHTRHQLQQMKASWDVERVSFYVICSAL